jgi:hypothetical protein
MPEPKKHTYQSTTLGLPPLRMVLVHAKNDSENARRRPAPAPIAPEAEEETAFDKERAIRKLIKHFEDGE